MKDPMFGFEDVIDIEIIGEKTKNNN